MLSFSFFSQPNVSLRHCCYWQPAPEARQGALCEACNATPQAGFATLSLPLPRRCGCALGRTGRGMSLLGWLTCLSFQCAAQTVGFMPSPFCCPMLSGYGLPKACQLGFGFSGLQGMQAHDSD